MELMTLNGKIVFAIFSDHVVVQRRKIQRLEHGL